MLMRQLLLLRGTFNVLFAGYLLIAPKDTMLGGYYGVIDGALALLLAVALFQSVRGRWLFFIVLLDGIVRLAFGGMLLLNPNITTNLLTGAFFATAVITVFIALGITGVLYGVVHSFKEQGHSGSPQSLVWPAVVASVSTALFGVGLILGPSGSVERRFVVVAYGLVFGLTLLFAGIRLRSSAALPEA